MAHASDAVIKLYEGAIRALDTKSQIFLAFIAITMAPVFNRLDAMGAPFWLRAAECALVAAATLAFIYCLFPRRGQRSEHGVFDTSMQGSDVMKMLQASDYNYNIGETVASLHDIYRVKSNSVAFGTALADTCETTRWGGCVRCSAGRSLAPLATGRLVAEGRLERFSAGR